jgi:pimeloyl-ACP methyl ester carboxylesterase
VTAPSIPLPAAVIRAIAAPPLGRSRNVDAGGHRWHALEWGEPADPPFLLIHGVTSDGGTFWRLGPAIAAAGRHVLAIDLPGHGRTGGWRGRHRFAETAIDVIGAVDGLGIARPDLAVLGHSWGGMVAAAFPMAGLVPRPLILLDPPALAVEHLEAMTRDPEEQPTADADAAAAALGLAHPDWHPGDVRAKADGLATFDREAVRAVLFDNGDWDAGLDSLAHPAARDADVWLIRGEWGAGGLIPDAALPALHERFGIDHVVTIPAAPHSPQRTHLEGTVAAILRALGAEATPDR